MDGSLVVWKGGFDVIACYIQEYLLSPQWHIGGVHKPNVVHFKFQISTLFQLSTMMSQPPVDSDMPGVQQGKQYFCDCSRHCKGRRTLVHRTTYQRHVAFREADLEKQLSCFSRGLNSTASASTSLVAGSPLEQTSTNDQSNGGATSLESNLMNVVPPEGV